MTPRDYVISLGFVPSGVSGCDCNGSKAESFIKDGLRVDLGTNNFWIKKKNPIMWTTMCNGHVNVLEEQLNKFL